MLGVNLRWTGVPLGRVNDSHPLSTLKTGDKDTGLILPILKLLDTYLSFDKTGQVALKKKIF